MNIAPEDLPLIVAQMTLIAAKEQELARMRQHLNQFILKHYSVDIANGQWHLDPSTGELTNALQGPDHEGPPDPR